MGQTAVDVTSLTSELLARTSALTNEELTTSLDEAFRAKTTAEGRFLVLLAEVGRREAFRDDGATSTQAWAAERFGMSAPNARTYAQVAEKAPAIPHLVTSLCAGDISFDKVRAVADVATPSIDGQLRDQALVCTVRDLIDVARAAAARRQPPPDSRTEHERRYMRFNDECRTITTQLPADSYAEAKACIDARAKRVPSDGETPLDQRRCDGFMQMVHASDSGTTSPVSSGAGGVRSVVVVHAPIGVLVDEAGESTELAGDLERGGLIDCATVKRLLCDATIAVAVDDDVGHTMYEGREERLATDAQRREVWRRDRHCRFPGCRNTTFTEVHHIVEWEKGGMTDLPNLALLCKHHHGVVHRDRWTMSGDASVELAFVGPSGRAMESRPSPRWTRVSDRTEGAPPTGG